MPKISGLIENEVPDPSSMVIMAPPTGDYYKTLLGNVSNIPSRKRMLIQECDMLNAGNTTSYFFPFTPAAIGAGTYGAIADEANHPGVARITSGALANTGALITSGIVSVLIGGLEVFEAIISLKLIANTAFRIGFTDTLSSAAAVDQVAFIHATGTIKGSCISNSAQTLTGTDYTPIVNTWYRLKIEVNAAASLVTFYIYDCATGALLWSDTISSNIPTAAGRETGFGAMAYKTTAGAAAVLDIDYMAYYNSKVLTR